MRHASRLALSVLLAAALLVPTGSQTARSAPAGPYDVIVYGATPGGVIAAVAAARMGAEVLLIEPSDHVGGMMSNGLSWTDRGDAGVIGGLADEFFDRVQGAEGSLRGRFAFQPHTAEAIFEAMLAEAGVTLVLGQPLAAGGVPMDGTRITGVVLASHAAFRPGVVIDASYEADLMAQAGVSHRIGREGTDEYGEPLAGVTATETVMPVGDGIDAGVPLLPPGSSGSADDRIQASNFRLCVTNDPANRVPFRAPDDYDPARYDLAAAYIAHRVAQGDPAILDLAVNIERTVRGKWDLNASGPVSVGIPGANYTYPEATLGERDEIAAFHRDYQQGYLHFLVTDPRVPPAIRAAFEPYGLCADEFTDNDNWPRRLYLREGRRMVGEQVVTQHDVAAIKSKPDVIGLASYRMDSHRVSRWIDDGTLFVEGELNSLAPSRWAIPFGSLVPASDEVTNLLVPVAASASHVAWTSLRMEPQFMIMGQAAGTGAAMAAERGIAVQDVPVGALQAILRATGAVLDDPGDIGSSTFYDEIAWAHLEGIIGFCGAPGQFCPKAIVTRQMMAAFLRRALELPSATRDYFTDDETSSMEGSINRVAEARIAFGCTTTTFCPTRPVTRAQMASFIVRAFDVPPATADAFTDDGRYATHEDDINALAAAGVAAGCTTTTYCPGQSVTRGQVMAFLYRASVIFGG